MNPQSTFHKKIGILIAGIVVCVVAVVIFLGEGSAPVPRVATTDTSIPTPAPTPVSTPTPVTPVTTPTPPVATPVKKTVSVYKDGTYSATGLYMSPGGEDQVAVTLTLANDIITSVTVTPTAGDHTSQRYQNRFVSGYKQYVIGKNIASVNLTVVSGSSLTPIGFNTALAQIKAQAKS